MALLQMPDAAVGPAKEPEHSDLEVDVEDDDDDDMPLAKKKQKGNRYFASWLSMHLRTSRAQLVAHIPLAPLLIDGQQYLLLCF